MKNKEIELKYKIDKNQSEVVIKAIVDFLKIPSLKEENMKAIYYDTLDNDLLKNHISFRIRNEGLKTMATVKARGTYEHGTFSRQEWNLDVSNLKDSKIEDVLLKMKCEEKLRSIVKDKPLVSKVTTEFIRRKTKIELNECLVELAYDKGEVITTNGKENLCELELELLEGERYCLEAFGKILSHQFGLKAEPISKYARGLRLLDLKNA